MRSTIRFLAYASLVFNITMVLLVVVLPKQWTRPVRRALAPIVLRLWVADSRLWSKVYEDLYMKGNGH